MAWSASSTSRATAGSDMSPRGSQPCFISGYHSASVIAGRLRNSASLLSNTPVLGYKVHTIQHLSLFNGTTLFAFEYSTVIS